MGVNMAPKKKHAKSPARKKKSSRRRAIPRGAPPPPPVSKDQAAFALAQTAFQAGALGEATRQAEQALNYNPGRADVLALLATCWTKRGDYTRAIECAQRATEVDASNPRWWHNLGWACLQMRNFAEAKTAYLREISTDPNLPEAYYNLARAELQLGETQAAADHLLQALSLRAELAQDARREFVQLASHPALAEWLGEKPAARSRKPSKKRPSKRRR
jgi:tetratricopeptide (TPR) repeat protein